MAVRWTKRRLSLHQPRLLSAYNSCRLLGPPILRLHPHIHHPPLIHRQTRGGDTPHEARPYKNLTISEREREPKGTNPPLQEPLSSPSRTISEYRGNLIGRREGEGFIPLALQPSLAGSPLTPSAGVLITSCSREGRSFSHKTLSRGKKRTDNWKDHLSQPHFNKIDNI